MSKSINSKLMASQMAVAIYAVFIGSQVTEGVLLVPYWQSLSSAAFYDYYAQFGPLIGRFYTLLTIVASLIPMIVAGMFWLRKRPGARYALGSAVLAAMVIACFYVYFKSANGHFYAQAFDELSLQKELIVWSQWHWGRIVLEILSLTFLILAFGKNER